MVRRRLSRQGDGAGDGGDQCGGQDQGDEGRGPEPGARGDGTGMDEQRPAAEVDQEQYGDETQVKDRQVTVTRGIAQAR